MTFLEQFKLARRVSTPLIAVRTPDPAATISSIAADCTPTKTPPLLVWDIARGLHWVEGNHLGEQVAKALWKENDPTSMQGPVDMLLQAQKMPAKTILFMQNLHLLFDAQVVQAIWNLRDQLKMNQRTLVITCPDITLPPLLAQDVLVLDEPLPTAEELAGIVGETYASANNSGATLAMPNNDTVTRCVDALAGLASFPAEQVCAMSIREDGMDISQLWERKRQQIEQTPGLSIYRGTDTFASVVGLENAKKYHRMRNNPKRRRRGIVFIDEIDKHLAGFGAVGTGDTTTEMVGALLTEMQDTEAEGSLFLGVAGSGKTLLGRAIANEWECPLVNFDLSGMKGSLVGQSGQNIRNALKVVRAITQGYVYYVATCNRIENLPPELRRRFTSATFFFDLMTRSEKNAAWDFYEKKFDVKGERPVDTGWTAAEIRNCCYNADVLNCSMVESAKFISPISVSSGDQITALRRQADQKYISASYEGLYKAPAGIEPEESPMVVAVGIIPGKSRRKIDTGTGGSGKGGIN